MTGVELLLAFLLGVPMGWLGHDALADAPEPQAALLGWCENDRAILAPPVTEADIDAASIGLLRAIEAHDARLESGCKK